MQLILRLIAPYLAVAVFWLGFRNGWLALLAYHAQILLWNRRALRWPRLRGGRALACGAALLGAGPLLYLLLPSAARVDLPVWLGAYRLDGWALVLLIPYFGVVHPVLEQQHWAPLRGRTPLAHLVFAGYHVLVLHSLLAWPWLALSAALLAGASVMWQNLARRGGDLGAATASHIGADLGLVLAAWLHRGGW